MGTWMGGEAVHQDAQEEAEQGHEGLGTITGGIGKGWPGLTHSPHSLRDCRLHSINTFLSGHPSSVVLESAAPTPRVSVSRFGVPSPRICIYSKFPVMLM